MDAPSPNVDSKSPPAAPEEAMDVQSTKFEDGVWYRKYQLLKRKCSEFEQVNKPLVHHVCVMHGDRRVGLLFCQTTFMPAGVEGE